jgi:hypothetical protein
MRRVLAEVGESLRAKEIQRRREASLGEPVSWSTVKQCLFDGTCSAKAEIRKVTHGTYS